ncbi:MAG: diguanylate cyclase [Thaumarchaeota archaeon]|nr:diguanylate cyclase [Nitrososphaerota archaeon]
MIFLHRKGLKLSSILQVAPDAMVLAVGDERDIQLIEETRECAGIAHLTIIALVSRSDQIIHAYDAGADNVLLDSQFHLVPAIIRQLSNRLHKFTVSPLTGLPSGVQVEYAMGKLPSKQGWSILYVDIDDFKSLNDTNGVLFGNMIIELLASVCRETVRERGNIGDFVGHIGGDDFLIISSSNRASDLSDLIRNRFHRRSRLLQSSLVSSLSVTNRGDSHVNAKLNQLSVSIGIVHYQRGLPKATVEIARLAAQAKANAKRLSVRQA